MFNPGLEALKRFVDPPEANSINLINILYHNPDFQTHDKRLELIPLQAVYAERKFTAADEFTLTVWFKTSNFYFDAQEPNDTTLR